MVLDKGPVIHSHPVSTAESQKLEMLQTFTGCYTPLKTYFIQQRKKRSGLLEQIASYTHEHRFAQNREQMGYEKTRK